LASCAAETVYTGLGGGGFATYYERASGRVRCLDFFVAVPGLDGTPLPDPEQISVDFGEQVVPYAVGPATVAVPGVPAGVAAVHERWGRLPWSEVVEPARRLAESGVECGPAQAKVLATVANAMLRGEGTDAYAPGGAVLSRGARLFHPGLAHAFEILREEGPRPFYDGEIADSILRSLGGDTALTQADLTAYRPVESDPRVERLRGHAVQARGDDLDDLLSVLADLDLSLPVDSDPADSARAMVSALRAGPAPSDTSNVVAVDAEGDACAMTTSLGLSSGVWLAGYGLHLNSMLGEGELVRGVPVPGARMGSMMTPLVVTDDDALVLVAGAAGGSRIRSALAQVLVHVVCGGVPVAAAIAAPRLNPVPGRVHAEPGFAAEVLSALEATDPVTVWAALDSYFGGVSGIDATGPGADPRRDGAARILNV
jgi:gamma-glutamyltranspeptidase/glutathione hydrolase